MTTRCNPNWIPFLLYAGLFLVEACGAAGVSATDTTQAIKPLTGAYALKSVGGMPMPYTLGQLPGLTVLIIGDTIRVDSVAMSWSEHYVVESIPPNQLDDPDQLTSGTIEYRGGYVIRHRPNYATDSALHTPNTLTFLNNCSNCNGYAPFVYRQ